ncbi:MAG: DUF1499 domain-containing protein [Ideonella sp.]
MNKYCLSMVVAMAASLAACALPADPAAPTVTALACSLPSNCVSSLDGGAAPLRFDGDAPQALARLKRTLAASSGARIVRSDATGVEAIFTTSAGFEDEVAFRIDAAQHRIDYRSRSRVGLFDFGKNRSRMREFAERFGAAGG